jgi:hypothetical protein
VKLQKLFLQIKQTACLHLSVKLLFISEVVKINYINLILSGSNTIKSFNAEIIGKL